MKIAKLTLLLTLCFSIAFVSSCKKDDDDGNNKTNFFTYDGQDYTIVKAFLEDFGDFGGGTATNFDLFLFTDGVDYSGNANQFEGVGNGLYFEMFTTSTTGLATGTYNYDATESGDANTFDLGYLFLDYNFTNSVGTFVNITSGTVTVTRNEASYDFSYTLTTAAGNQITGNYSGTAPVIE